jgi:hypothetical protein
MFVGLDESLARRQEHQGLGTRDLADDVMIGLMPVLLLLV